MDFDEVGSAEVTLLMSRVRLLFSRPGSLLIQPMTSYVLYSKSILHDPELCKKTSLLKYRGLPVLKFVKEGKTRCVIFRFFTVTGFLYFSS